MPPDLAAAHSQDRYRHRWIRRVSAQLNGHCDHAVRTFWRLKANRSPMPTIREDVSVRPNDPTWTVAPHIPRPNVVVDRGGS
jgi:hypothetical protein